MTDHFKGLTGLEVAIKHWHMRNGHEVREGAVVCEGCEHEMRDLFATLRTAGFAVVPVEPTQKMVQAAYSAYMGEFDISAGDEITDAIASDMRDAVREAIKAAQGGVDE